MLANRLSASSRHSVLLLEAGRDTPPGEEPADVLDVYPTSYYNKAYMWPGLRAHWRTRETSPAITLDQGRIMGGGSSVMGMVALRGTPDDYDEWEALGAKGWGWDDVLPYFRKLETDLDFDGDLHGQGGPTPIRRVPRAEWTPLAQRVAGLRASAQQLPTIADMNARFPRRLHLRADEQHGRAARLDGDLLPRRRRPPPSEPDHHGRGATWRRLLFEGRRVVGVEVRGPASAGASAARETIVAAGALQSPAMLLRAGIGPAEALRGLGIEVRADRPGVGANLQNHPVLFVGAHLRPHGRQPPSLRTLQVTGLRLSSGVPGCPPTDLYFNIQSKSSWNALGEQIANLGAGAVEAVFARARHAAAARPDGPPLVEFNFLADERDLRRMMIGFRRVVDIVASRAGARPHGKAVSGALHRPPAAPQPAQPRQRAQGARPRADAAGQPGSLSDWILARLTGGAEDSPTLAADDERLAEHVRANIAGTFHVCGTCRMGAADDPDAVVDAARPRLRRRGPARRRRLRHADRAARQHQHPDDHGRREARGRHPLASVKRSYSPLPMARTMSSRRLVSWSHHFLNSGASR